MNAACSARPVTLFAASLFAAVLPLCAQPARQSPARPQEQANPQASQPAPVVVSVRILKEGGAILSTSPKELPIEIGKPLDREAVAQSLRSLYASGNFAGVKAVTTDVPGGVRLDFIVEENFFFSVVEIRGLTPPPTLASAEAAMQRQLGHVYRAQIVDEAVARLKDTLQNEGLYQARVSVETVPHPDTREMDIIATVSPGPRARAGAVQITNGTEYPDAELLRRLKMKPGREITSARIQSGTSRIRKFLVKKGHLGARAQVRLGEYDASSNTVPLNLEVTEGPRVQLAVTGAKISQSELKKLVPIYQEGAIDSDLLEEGRRNLQERFERKGYFDAKVSFTTENREAPNGRNGHGAEEVVTYHIDRGIHHRLVGIALVGNEYFSNEILRSHLQDTPGAFGIPDRFSRRLIDTDVTSLRNLYLSNGFLSAEVKPVIQDNYRGKPGNLFITFEIKEGSQTRVASLSITGNHNFTDQQLLDVIGSTPGQPYSEFGVATDRDNILALYFNDGFPDASFTAGVHQAPSEPPQQQAAAPGQPKPPVAQAPPVSLVYHIEEGRQLRVRNLFIAGYQHTRPSVIRREVTVKPHEPLRQGEVVETQRRLYNFGIFNRVTVEPQNPNCSDPDKNVGVLFEEAKRYTMTYGGGFEVQRLGSTTNPTAGQIQAAPRGIFEITKNNFTGRADSLSFKVRGSTIEDRALLAYSLPNAFANPHYGFEPVAYTEKTQDINTFTATRYKGTFNSVELSDADTYIGSSASFLRFYFQNSTYHPIKPGFSFARSVRFGVLAPYRETVSLTFPAPTTPPLPVVIPLPERFFAGGGTSLRGFGLNQAGPRDSVTGFPVGGQAELIFNQEIRFPMRLPFVGTSLGGAIFYDAGNVYTRLDQISFRLTLPKPTLLPQPPNTQNPLCTIPSQCTNSLHYFSNTVGLGLRYATPVGPIRVDLGYLINRPEIVVPCQTGSTACFKLTRLPAFQIFFNFGSSF